MRNTAIEVDERRSRSIPHLHDSNVSPYHLDQDDVLKQSNLRSRPVGENANTHRKTSKYTSSEYKYPKNKQSIGELVRKLNCTSSKKSSYDPDEHLTARDASCISAEADFAVNHSSLRKSTCGPLRADTSTDITRPVLITVKNGESNKHIPSNNKNSENPEVKNSFIIGQLSKPMKISNSSPFRLGMSSRKRQHNATKYFKTISSTVDGTRTDSEWYKNQQDMDSKRAAQEAARRERWKRGLEMENRMFKNPSTGRSERDGYDSSSTDSLTMGSNTTGTSTTGYDTVDSSSMDDWTDVTDDSRLASRYYRHYGRNSSGGPCADSQEIVESVVEDIGIIAKFLLSDGTACFGTAAAITKETVGVCRGKKV